MILTVHFYRNLFYKDLYDNQIIIINEDYQILNFYKYL